MATDLPPYFDKPLWMSVKQAGALLGVSPGLLYDLIRTGQIPQKFVKKLGDRRLIATHWVEMGMDGDEEEEE